MFDPAILLALEGPMPPQPPVAAIVENWVSPTGALARQLGQKLAADYEAQARAYLNKVESARLEVESWVFPKATASDLATLDDRIAETEAHAELRAIYSARTAKRIRKDVKTLFKNDPSVGAATRELGDRLIATDKLIVDALLDWALILRAIRAEGSGEARGGPVFDDAETLAKHLDMLAA